MWWQLDRKPCRRKLLTSMLQLVERIQKYDHWGSCRGQRQPPGKLRSQTFIIGWNSGESSAQPSGECGDHTRKVRWNVGWVCSEPLHEDPNESVMLPPRLRFPSPRQSSVISIDGCQPLRERFDWPNSIGWDMRGAIHEPLA